MPGNPTGQYRSLSEVLDELERYRAESQKDPKVAFVIAGGGATGAYEAGVIDAYLRAVAGRPPERQRGLQPTLIIGTSAGALNAVTVLLERLGLGHPAIGGVEGETFGSAVWRAIGSAHSGAAYVVGRRQVLVSLMTRWLKHPVLKKLVTTLLPALVLLLLNPMLFAWLAGKSGQPWLQAASAWIFERPVVSSLLMTLMFALILAGVVIAFWRAMFANAALSATIANAVRPDGPVPPGTGANPLRKRRSGAELQEVGRRVVGAWEKARQGGSAPEFIVTATDLTARRDALFTLVGPETFARLADQKWAVFQIGGTAAGLCIEGNDAFLGACGGLAGATEAGELIRCVVASTSIPGVFPSQRITLRTFRDGGKPVVHDFVDGGVLNNAPVHVAIDAGATHVISLELNSLRQPDSLDTSAKGDEPLLPGNVVGSFMTMLENATAEDIRKAAAVNRQIDKLQKSGQPAPAGEGEGDAKRTVKLYRVAPAWRKVGTIEFNGHYDKAFSGPSVGLVDWVNEGRTSAEKGHVFWDATLETAPGAGVDPPDSCELCVKTG